MRRRCSIELVEQTGWRNMSMVARHESARSMLAALVEGVPLQSRRGRCIVDQRCSACKCRVHLCAIIQDASAAAHCAQVLRSSADERLCWDLKRGNRGNWIVWVQGGPPVIRAPIESDGPANTEVSSNNRLFVFRTHFQHVGNNARESRRRKTTTRE